MFQRLRRWLFLPDRHFSEWQDHVHWSGYLQAHLWDFIEAHQILESLRSYVWPVKTALIHCASLLPFSPDLFHRGASASTRDYLTAPPSPLHLNLLPQYNDILQA
ncbi:MAG: hypothetical protein Nkreftii_001821 [Candidatus Nitrospira kreftii]|uniref:Uncharacterized protein n=1 Tax=Candidatus Nitrospira kreftii TaxID=2652173 RepID=A0A7S8FDU3_9BACT|nr:MAG: hypothetical protein Nkreftii_001821 [Candidatus Nitrospira kreftii]